MILCTRKCLHFLCYFLILSFLHLIMSFFLMCSILATFVFVQIVLYKYSQYSGLDCILKLCSSAVVFAVMYSYL